MGCSRCRVTGLTLMASLGLALGGMAVGQVPSAPATPASATVAGTTSVTAAPPAARDAANALDQPLQWLQEARKSYSGVRDYTCTLLKQERMRGRMQDQNIILMKFRAQPFSVYMRWLSPQPSAGQEVAFIYGRNNNQMRVHFASGLKSTIGWKSVDPNDRRVFEQSRHNIYEAGIGNMIEQLIQSLEKERQRNKTQVRIAEYTYNNRRCHRVECIGTERDPQSPVYRCVFYLDKESKLPIRMETYDWPVVGGAATGEPIETFSFVDLRFNVSLSDRDFAR
ncbi:MAG: DUF1571 domain-containing protein [Planctomycetes bacterium]|nr:DUF1571 domain-containing protein [Planctomycetota bacterium]